MQLIKSNNLVIKKLFVDFLQDVLWEILLNLSNRNKTFI